MLPVVVEMPGVSGDVDKLMSKLLPWHVCKRHGALVGLMYGDGVVNVTLVVGKCVEEAGDGSKVMSMLVFSHKAQVEVGTSPTLDAIGADEGLNCGGGLGVLDSPGQHSGSGVNLSPVAPKFHKDVSGFPDGAVANDLGDGCSQLSQLLLWATGNFHAI